MATFADLGVSAPVLQSIGEMGFEEPTPVQAQAIPSLLGGRDVVAQALTGTGKTAAFGIPLVERIDVARAVPQAVVLAPTRELAIQVAQELSAIGRHRGLRLVPIYGGQPIDRQLLALRRGVHAIVATPGRLMDHMRRGTVDLSSVALLVLDEADVMLDMGFLEDVEQIMAGLPAERVTALFSATMPNPILELSRRYMRDPELIRLSRPRELTVPEIDQVYYQVTYQRKFDALCRVLDVKQLDRTLVFCATKRTVDQVVETLQGSGYLADGLHGDMSQTIRERVMRAFRAGQLEVLVATDVAARGLDVPDVGLVVNFDIPPDPEYYVHRIGRTGRLGRRGEAITFVNPWEMRELHVIERITGAHLRREQVPTGAEVEERETQVLVERLEDVLAKGSWGRFRGVVEGLLEDHDPADVAAAAVSLAAASVGRSRRVTRPARRPSEPDEERRPHAGPPRPSGRPRTGDRPWSDSPRHPRRRSD
jgi:ATP-dependent RNA helicase DeaD